MNFQQQQFLYLTTTGWRTGRQHRIEIWFVDYDDKYYVMSERREHAHWVQNIMRNSRILFNVNFKSFEGTARIVYQQNDSKFTTKISALMNSKYRWDEGLIIEITPH